jgi:hypothetical protein
VADMLAVALGHFDDFGRNRDELAATLLHAVAAALAHRERDLIARASDVPRALKHLAAEEQEGGIFVERLAGIAPDLGHCFAKGREYLARQLESKHVPLRPHVRSIVRTASRTMSRNQLLNLADGAPLGLLRAIPSRWKALRRA